jgi:hypothetical protein
MDFTITSDHLVLLSNSTIAIYVHSIPNINDTTNTTDTKYTTTLSKIFTEIYITDEFLNQSFNAPNNSRLITKTTTKTIIKPVDQINDRPDQPLILLSGNLFALELKYPAPEIVCRSPSIESAPLNSITHTYNITLIGTHCPSEEDSQRLCVSEGILKVTLLGVSVSSFNDSLFLVLAIVCMLILCLFLLVIMRHRKRTYKKLIVDKVRP